MRQDRSGERDGAGRGRRGLGHAVLYALPVIVPLVALGAAGVYAGLGLLKRSYTAEARILIERADAAPSRPGDPRESQRRLSAEEVQSEIRLIGSRDLAQSVADELGLSTLVDPMIGAASNPLFEHVGLADADEDPTNRRSLPPRSAEALRVAPGDAAGVVDIAVSAADPQLAARIANALAETYVELKRAAIPRTPVDEAREEQLTLRAQVVRLSTTLGPAHPRVRQLNAELADLGAELRDAERQAPAALPNGDAIIDARILAPALAPAEAAFPDRLPVTAAVTAALFLLALATVLLRERLAGAGPSRATERLPLPVQASLQPAIAPPSAQPSPLPTMRWSEGGDVRRIMPAAPSFARPDIVPSEVQESLRMLADRVMAIGARRTVVGMAAETRVARRPLAAVALARQLSRRGARVLLVELNSDGADGAAMAPDGERLTGFADLFAGEASFAQAIFRDRSSRAHIIPSGSRPLPADLCGDERLEAILGALDATYDHIILDTDRVLAMRLAPQAGAIVLVARKAEGDPETLAARLAFADVTKAEVMLLVAAPPSQDDEAPDPDPETEVA